MIAWNKRRYLSKGELRRSHIDMLLDEIGLTKDRKKV
jgi:hypothetical protein